MSADALLANLIAYSTQVAVVVAAGAALARLTRLRAPAALLGWWRLLLLASLILPLLQPWAGPPVRVSGGAMDVSRRRRRPHRRLSLGGRDRLRARGGRGSPHDPPGPRPRALAALAPRRRSGRGPPRSRRDRGGRAGRGHDGPALPHARGRSPGHLRNDAPGRAASAAHVEPLSGRPGRRAAARAAARLSRRLESGRGRGADRRRPLVPSGRGLAALAHPPRTRARRGRRGSGAHGRAPAVSGDAARLRSGGGRAPAGGGPLLSATPGEPGGCLDEGGHDDERTNVGGPGRLGRGGGAGRSDGGGRGAAAVQRGRGGGGHRAEHGARAQGHPEGAADLSGGGEEGRHRGPAWSSTC